MASQRLEDLHTPEQYIRLAATLESDWLKLKHYLVQRRKDLTDPKHLADFLDITEQEVLDFEQYDYDPTKSQLNEYAMALGVRIQPTAHEVANSETTIFANNEHVADIASSPISLPDSQFSTLGRVVQNV
ncbi:hypothetical protein [Bifidobacterium oedipodis]|uniref:Uncharacterized protein n=1 Tax=Bifidobacterium oedipodis TaxID=2675322 RepID=A0A7Y0EQN7_9BIFI|nr:hypothetical protein [Bifidobacterium sp. DSM 109957]NMM94686.1 hypothetical protein [Bifidobacterium sp. DSM 109957]